MTEPFNAGIPGALHNLPLSTGSTAPAAADGDDRLASRWLHCDANSSDAREWLATHTTLSDQAVDELFAEETRPRIATRGSRLLITVRGINPGSDGGPEDMVSLRLWTDGTRIISTQLRTLAATERLLSHIEATPQPLSVPELMLSWLEQIVDDLDDGIGDLGDMASWLEEYSLTSERKVHRRDFTRLRKQCIVLRRFLAPQRDALFRLMSEPLEWFDEASRLRLRELVNRQMRQVEAVDELRDRAAVAHEELMSQLSEQMNARMYVMSVAAAVFLPLGFFTGLMGINVGGMPGVDDPNGFWFVAGLCGSLLVTLLLVFRRKQWL